MFNRFVAYYRVSTDKQGKSGLGLEAQREVVTAYINHEQGKLVGEFQEVESGKSRTRPELRKAIAAAKLYDATLVIAKLDRLARNAYFLLSLRDAGVKFVACDMPQANNLTVTIMAAVAEEEAKMISDRTKAALKAAKARGVALGGFRGRSISREDAAKGNEVRKTRSIARAAQFRAEVDRIIGEGHNTLKLIAAELNARNIPTPSRRGAWQPTMVSRVLQKTGAYYQSQFG